MPNANLIILIGHVTREPELKYLPSNMAVVEFGLAVNRGAKAKQETLFMDCTAFDKTAETISKYVKKGNAVYVQGYLKQHDWNDRDTGKKRTKIEMVVQVIQFLSKPADKPEQRPDDEFMPDADDDQTIPF